MGVDFHHLRTHKFTDFQMVNKQILEAESIKHQLYFGDAFLRSEANNKSMILFSVKTGMKVVVSFWHLAVIFLKVDCCHKIQINFTLIANAFFLWKSSTLYYDNETLIMNFWFALWNKEHWYWYWFSIKRQKVTALIFTIFSQKWLLMMRCPARRDLKKWIVGGLNTISSQTLSKITVY